MGVWPLDLSGSLLSSIKIYFSAMSLLDVRIQCWVTEVRFAAGTLKILRLSVVPLPFATL